MTAQPLLIALVSVQFLVQALLWAMTARMARRWWATEGHFALFWLFLACGLMLYVPPWASGSAPRNLGDLLIVGATAFQHRGLALYWGRRPRAWHYAALMSLALAVLVASFFVANGHGLRVADVCLGAGVMLMASAHLMWVFGRATTPVFAAVTAAGYALLALLLLGRGVQALMLGATTKISIDAPGHANIPFAILVLFIGGLINLSHVRLVLGRVLALLNLQAKTDELTGALNRRGLLQQLEALHEYARQGSSAYALMMLDVDHFKTINDSHGHTEGDRVLKHVVASTRASLRGGDLVGRWGGEEFCVVLPRTDLADAQQLAHRVASHVAATDCGIPVTVSIGVAQLGAADANLQSVIRRADNALYRAKESGRNRVVAAKMAVD